MLRGVVFPQELNERGMLERQADGISHYGEIAEQDNAFTKGPRGPLPVIRRYDPHLQVCITYGFPASIRTIDALLSIALSGNPLSAKRSGLQISDAALSRLRGCCRS